MFLLSLVSHPLYHNDLPYLPNVPIEQKDITQGKKKDQLKKYMKYFATSEKNNFFSFSFAQIYLTQPASWLDEFVCAIVYNGDFW